MIMKLRSVLSDIDCSNRPHTNEQVWINSPKCHRLTNIKTLKSVTNGDYDELTADLLQMLESEVKDYDFDYSRLCNEDLIIIKVNLK